MSPLSDGTPGQVRRWFTLHGDEPVVVFLRGRAKEGWVLADMRGPLEIEEGLWAWCFEWGGNGPAPPVTARRG